MDLVFNLQLVVISVLDKWEEKSDFWTYNNFLQESYSSIQHMKTIIRMRWLVYVA